jgi:uridine phosphorylase
MNQPHILCGPEDISPYVILPGDPQRVLRIREYLEDVREIAFNREFRTITGLYKGVPITVTSTGIGGPSAAIALEELIACGGKYFIRIGSGGAVQSSIELGDLVIAIGAVREEGTSKMYVKPEFPAVADYLITKSVIESCEELGYPHHIGIVRSHDSFYIDEEKEVMEYWNKKGILCSDMETATLLTLSKLRKVRAGSILNNVVKYESDVKIGIEDYVKEGATPLEGEKREILVALESFIKIHQNNEGCNSL